MNPAAVDLSGRKALVTGGSRGIGESICRLLAGAGATVAVHYGGAKDRAEAVAAALAGCGHVALGADLFAPHAAADLPGRAAEALGGLDILVNNAGIYEPHDVEALEPDAWHEAWSRTIAVNLTAPALIIKGALPHLARGKGHIVNVSSRGAFRGEPEAPAYGASKAGLNALGQSLAVALGPLGIHVVTVAPGWVPTDMTAAYLEGPAGEAIRAQSPLGRTATCDEVAQVVLLAVSGKADAMTGGIVDVNGASYLRS